jgi:hypothetical protein
MSITNKKNISTSGFYADASFIGWVRRAVLSRQLIDTTCAFTSAASRASPPSTSLPLSFQLN